MKIPKSLKTRYDKAAEAYRESVKLEDDFMVGCCLIDLSSLDAQLASWNES